MSSSQRFRAVLGLYETVYQSLRTRLQSRRDNGHLVISDTDFENLLRVVRLEIHDALVTVYTQGQAEGAARVRFELGVPQD